MQDWRQLCELSGPHRWQQDLSATDQDIPQDPPLRRQLGCIWDEQGTN